MEMIEVLIQFSKFLDGSAWKVIGISITVFAIWFILRIIGKKRIKKYFVSVIQEIVNYLTDIVIQKMDK